MRLAAIFLGLAALLASTAAAGEERAERSVTELVKALKEGDEKARTEAAREIAERKIKAGRATYVLRKMMLTESGGALLATADALEKTGTNMAKTVKELTAQLAGSEPAARARAAWALSLIPSAGSAASSIAPLAEDTDDWVRVSAACALLRFGHEYDRMVQLLVGALGHAEARVRCRAIHGLRYLPGVSELAVSALATIAAKGGEEGVRACLTLAELGPRALSALPTLRSLLESDDMVLVMAAAPAFGSLGPEAAKHVPELLDRMMIIGPDYAKASLALAGMGATAVPALIRAFEEGDIIRQTRAVSVLELLGPLAAPAVPALMREIPIAKSRWKVYDDQRSMQAIVIRTLGKIGKAARPALPALEKLAKMKPGEMFQLAAQHAVWSIRAADR